MSTAVVIPEPIVTYAPTRPIEVMPELQQVSRGHVSIVSIWPAALRAERRHNGITTYQMAAAPRGSYSKLVVYDTQQMVPQPSERSAKPEWSPRPIPAIIIAQDLVSTWGGDTLGARSGYRPGIGMIAGDNPTVEELAALRSTQNALFNWFITDANGKHMSGEGVLISDTHRLAAKEMLDRGAERLAWYPVVDFAAVKDCVACGKQINQNALRCDHCTTMLPDFYMKYEIVPANDPAVASFIERIKLQTENKDLKAKAQAIVDVPKDPPPAPASKDARLVQK